MNMYCCSHVLTALLHATTEWIGRRIVSLKPSSMVSDISVKNSSMCSASCCVGDLWVFCAAGAAAERLRSLLRRPSPPMLFWQPHATGMPYWEVVVVLLLVVPKV